MCLLAIINTEGSSVMLDSEVRFNMNSDRRLDTITTKVSAGSVGHGVEGQEDTVIP